MGEKRGGERGEGRGWGSIGFKLLHDLVNGVIHSSIFMYICINLSFCFIRAVLCHYGPLWKYYGCKKFMNDLHNLGFNPFFLVLVF